MMQLTVCERVQRGARHLPTDCVATITAGLPLRDFCTDLQAMVRARLALYAQAGQDIIAIGADNFYTAPLPPAFNQLLRRQALLKQQVIN